jgi:hypothetical protein
MKKLYPLAFALLLVSSAALAQVEPEATVPTVPRTEEYCTVTAHQLQIGSTRFEISVDYGSGPKPLAPNRYKSEGEFFAFKSVVDALNYQNSHGWELVNSFSTFPIGMNSGTGTQYYVMKRRLKP